MSRAFKYLMSAIAAVVVASGASAQTAAPANAPNGWLQQLNAYIDQPNTKKELVYFLQLLEEHRRGDCQRVDILSITPAALGRVAFDALGAPTQGVWRVELAIERCGERVTHNILFQAQGGRISPGLMMPGTTRAPFAMQEGLGWKVVQELNKDRPIANCNKFPIMDTQQSIASGRLGGGQGAWTERWTVGRCGRRDDVFVDFAVNERGNLNFAVRTQ
ncbi:MAG: hypothetical protein AAF360_19355 [Pseudomonadota bacterium]